MLLRIATFNLENLDDGPNVEHIQSGRRSTFDSLDELFEQLRQLIQASQ